MRRRREPQVTEPALDPDLRLRLQRLVRPKWYAERHPSTGDALVDPVEDFLSRGCFESDDPTPLFDGEWYCSVYGLHGLADPVLHYLQSGAARGFDPSPAFDARWYMRACGALPPDVTPLEHYLTHGGSHGLDPHPLFSSAWYLQQDVGELGELTPLEHLLANGSRAGREPSCLFRSQGYLIRNPDVAASGTDPFLHYLKFGMSEGRESTLLWDDSEYKEWFSDDVLVQRLGSLAHFRHVVVPNGRRIESQPIVDSLARRLVDLEDRASSFIRGADDDDDGARSSLDWTARAQAMRDRTSDSTDTSVAILGGGPGAIVTLEGLLADRAVPAPEVALISEFEDPVLAGKTRFERSGDSSASIAVLTAILEATSAPRIAIVSAGMDVAGEWLRALSARMDSDPALGLVGSVVVAEAGYIQEAGRITDGVENWSAFGAGASVGSWAIGTYREVDSCALSGALVRREVIESLLRNVEPLTSTRTDDALMVALRGLGLSTAIEPRALAVQCGISSPEIAFEMQSSSSVPWDSLEQFIGRDRRQTPHIVVVADVESLGLCRVFDSLLSDAHRVHIISSSGRRPQPETDRLERAGVEVIDAEMGSETMRNFLLSIQEDLEFLLFDDPAILIRWASFTMEHLAESPIVLDASRLDQSIIGSPQFHRVANRLADVVIVPSDANLLRAGVATLLSVSTVETAVHDSDLLEQVRGAVEAHRPGST